MNAFKQLIDSTEFEIKNAAGWNVDVDVHVQPEQKNKHLFLVSAKVIGLDEPIIVEKSGKHVQALLRKVRKAVVRRVRRFQARRIARRRRLFWKEQWV